MYLILNRQQIQPTTILRSEYIVLPHSLSSLEKGDQVTLRSEGIDRLSASWSSLIIIVILIL